MIIPSVVALSVAGFAAHGAFHRNSRLFGDVLGRLPTDEPYVALTFDDGPNPEATPRILDELARQEVHATFFGVGRNVEQWPEIAQRIVSEGHDLGNHGYFHRSLHFRSPHYVRRDVSLGTRAIRHATGRRPAFFRAPHGFRNPWVSRAAASLGQRTVGWSVNSWDAQRPGTAAIVRSTTDAVRPGAIVLMHDGDASDPRGDRAQTVEAIPELIGNLRDRGYRFVLLPAQ